MRLFKSPFIQIYRKRSSARLSIIMLAIAASVMSADGQNQVVSVGFAPKWEGLDYVYVAPGGVVTLFTSDLGVPDAAATQLPLPTELSGVSVLVRVIGAANATGYPSSLPVFRIHSVKQKQLRDGSSCPAAPNAYCAYSEVTVEIPTYPVCTQTSLDTGHPCSDPANFRDIPPLLVLNVKSNGITGPDMTLLVQKSTPHALNSCDSIFGELISPCRPLITHADGTIVEGPNPARTGEVITIYAVGLGVAGDAPLVLFEFPYPLAAESTPPGFPAFAQSGRYVQPTYVGLVPLYVGLYQINVKVPPVPGGAPPCLFASNGWVRLNSPNGEQIPICVQP